MTNRAERTALVGVLAFLKEQQKSADSKTLDKLIKYTERWIKKLYKDATKYTVDSPIVEPPVGYTVPLDGGD